MSSTNIRTEWDAFIPRNIRTYNDSQYSIELPAGKIIKRQVKGEDRRKCQKAVRGIFLMVDTFFDFYKKNAFQSAIEEPAQSYFDRFGEDKDGMLSSFRSLQVYLYLINKNNWFGLEIRTSVMTNKELMLEDCLDILAGLPRAGYRLLKEETNAWLDNESVRDLEKNGILESNNQEKHKIFHEIAASFSFFFRKDVLVKRMFEVLYSYDRFQKYCNDLYPLFREEHGFHENTIFDFLYDSGLEDLNIDKAARFFWFCGVIHERDAQITWNTAQKSCSQSKHVKDCRKNLKMRNSLEDEIIDHDQESAVFNMKNQISVMC